MSKYIITVEEQVENPAFNTIMGRVHNAPRYHFIKRLFLKTHNEVLTDITKLADAHPTPPEAVNNQETDK